MNTVKRPVNRPLTAAQEAKLKRDIAATIKEVEGFLKGQPKPAKAKPVQPMNFADHMNFITARDSSRDDIQGKLEFFKRLHGPRHPITRAFARLVEAHDLEGAVTYFAHLLDQEMGFPDEIRGFVIYTGNGMTEAAKVWLNKRVAEWNRANPTKPARLPKAAAPLSDIV